ncbi:hypothetical protein PFISCL1PPCAC_1458 [Pristionchus fissidentatus]|uniref:Uncharacterized protein n=1 Tax=Pristionchus fissidentatus TaxID=1538716 RepID=A0AAV5UUK3_9BILA|nr:hypothetical protein PFISCL1PPCAC_1458 [Pristionchus fissidentatus]
MEDNWIDERCESKISPRCLSSDHPIATISSEDFLECRADETDEETMSLLFESFHLIIIPFSIFSNFQPSLQSLLCIIHSISHNVDDGILGRSSTREILYSPSIVAHSMISAGRRRGPGIHRAASPRPRIQTWA